MPRINMIRITFVLKLCGHSEHRMSTQPLDVIGTTHVCVYVFPLPRRLAAVVLSDSLVNIFPVHSNVLNFARQYQFGDSKESKEEIKS